MATSTFGNLVVVRSGSFAHGKFDGHTEIETS